jgi:hypothetical protein
MNMRLLGARTIDELAPEMVDASALHSHAGLTPPDNLYNTTCEFILFNRVIFLLIMNMFRRSTPGACPVQEQAMKLTIFGVPYLSSARAGHLCLIPIWLHYFVILRMIYDAFISTAHDRLLNCCHRI